MTTGSRDPAASRDQLRAGHADRDQVIETLKTAFVDGRLTKNELDAQTGRALAARTYADLAALSADIPAKAAEPVAAPSGPARPLAQPPASAIRRPLAKAAAASGVCLVVVAAARQLNNHFDPGGPGPDPHHSLGAMCFLVGVIALMAALFILGTGIVISIEQRRSGRKPPRPSPGGPGLDAGRRDGTGHDQVSPGSQADQTRTDLRARKSHGGARPIRATA